MAKVQTLNHPNILKVYEYIVSDKHLYEITEFMNEEIYDKKSKLVKKQIEYVPKNLL